MARVETQFSTECLSAQLLMKTELKKETQWLPVAVTTLLLPKNDAKMAMVETQFSTECLSAQLLMKTELKKETQLVPD
jgi:hypothetical protein